VIDSPIPNSALLLDSFMIGDRLRITRPIHGRIDIITSFALTINHL
jgi:hypothetical protein